MMLGVDGQFEFGDHPVFCICSLDLNTVMHDYEEICSTVS